MAAATAVCIWLAKAKVPVIHLLLFYVLLFFSRFVDEMLWLAGFHRFEKILFMFEFGRVFARSVVNIYEKSTVIVYDGSWYVFDAIFKIIQFKGKQSSLMITGPSSLLHP